MRPVLSRRLVPAAAASGVAVVPALVAALVAGAVPVPGGGDGPTVHAVVTTGPLGYVGNPADPFPPLDGAHPVTRPLGVVDVRPAVSRGHAPGPDVSDTALPARVLAAYRSAARSLGRTDPACELDWTLLAGIGKVESGHAYGGAVDRAGDTLVPILGPALDGSNPAMGLLTCRSPSPSTTPLAGVPMSIPIRSRASTGKATTTSAARTPIA
jgi:hypothetical protein